MRNDWHKWNSGGPTTGTSWRRQQQGFWKTSFYHDYRGSMFLRNGGMQLYTERIFVVLRMKKYEFRNGTWEGYNLFIRCKLIAPKKNAFCEAASVHLQYFFKVKKSYVTCKNVAEEFLKNIARQPCRTKVQYTGWRELSLTGSVLNKNKRTKFKYFLDYAWFVLSRKANSQNKGCCYEQPHAVREVSFTTL